MAKDTTPKGVGRQLKDALGLAPSYWQLNRLKNVEVRLDLAAQAAQFGMLPDYVERLCSADPEGLYKVSPVWAPLALAPGG